MPQHADSHPTEPDAVTARLLDLLDTLGDIARRMHPPHLPLLVARLAEPETALRAALRADEAAPATAVREQLLATTARALQACDGLHMAEDADNPMIGAYRALRQYSRALELLAGLAETLPAVSRYLLEPAYRDDPLVLSRLAGATHPDTGLFHFSNATDQRGGCSVYIPPQYDPDRPHPVVTALHGGAGHGRLFVCNWLPEARSRGLIVIAPTATGDTWSLMEPDIDAGHLLDVLTQVRARWSVDPTRLLLTGMSDGGTFTLLSGVDEDCPFTHLAPFAASFHPMLLAMTEPERLNGLPVYLTHGAMDWMFPVSVARTAQQALTAAGAAVVYREVPDLSHAYPRDEQAAVLDWFLS